MSNNPYSFDPAPPNYPGHPVGGHYTPPPYDPTGAVKGPAISLIVVQGVSIAGFLVSIVVDVFLLASGNSQVADPLTLDLSGSTVLAVRLVLAVTLLAVNLGTLFGSIQMLRRRNFPLAMTASVISVIPCLSGCYCLGIPFGIWALVVLMKPEVRQAFR